MIPFKWENLTASEFDEAIEKSGGLCILPIGCMERHGDFLGSAADSIQARTVAEATAEKEYAVVFPVTMWLGTVMGAHSLTDEMLDKPCQKRGYIATHAKYMIRLLTELCEEIHRNGFRKILILNGHGGNIAMLDTFLQVMASQRRDYAVMLKSIYPPGQFVFRDLHNAILANPEEYTYLNDEEIAFIKRFGETGTGGGHADIREVSVCMSKTPEAVRPELIVGKSSTHKADYLESLGVVHGEGWTANFPMGVDAEFSAYGCTQNIGKAFLHFSSDAMANIFRTLKQDEVCVEMAQWKI